MKNKIIVIGIVVALVAATSLKLFSNKQHVEENVYMLDPNKRILVQADTATVKGLERVFTYTGSFTAYREVMIVPQVKGEVVNVYFNEGDFVQKGKTLVQIDDELLQAQHLSANANYETAKRNLERYENASSGGGVSPIQLDNYRLNLKNAESQLRQLFKQISWSKVEAPFAGTITYKDVEKGSIVGNSAIARITDLSQLKLEISVPEKEIGLFREDDAVQIVTDVFPGKSMIGKVDYVSDRGDAAHNYTVKVLVQNNNSLTTLKAGMYGTVSINKNLNEKTIVIPRAALLGSAKNPQVFVVENNKVKLTSIVTGGSNGDYVEVTNGLREGDLIATSGQINLADGSNVEIIKK